LKPFQADSEASNCARLWFPVLINLLPPYLKSQISF